MANKSLPAYFRKAFQDFSGGLNNHESPLIIKPSQFATLTNARVNDRGLLEKAAGYSVDGSPFPDDVDSFIRMLVNYKRGTSVDNIVCAAVDEGNTNANYKVDIKDSPGTGTYSYINHTAGTNASFTNANTAVVGVGTTWSSHLKAGDKIKATSHTDAMYTEIASVTNDTNLVLVAGGYLGATAATVAYEARIILHKDFIPSAITFNNNLVITNGSETPMVWNNTTLNLLTDAQAPKGKFICAHKSRVFIAATSGGPSTLFWSAVNDETSWDAAALEPVFANDNGNICAIRSFADSLIVFKENGNIYQVVGSFDQDAVGEPAFIRRIDTPDNIGGIAGYTVSIGDDNKLYFLAETGMFSLDTRMYVDKVSWNIQDTINDLTLRSILSQSKSYVYDTKTQWDNGTYSGTMCTSAGTLKNHFGYKSITDASQNSGTTAGSSWTGTDFANPDHPLSVTIDSSNDVHVAYVSSSNTAVIKYKKWLASDDSYSVEETAVTAAGTIKSLSISVASGGNVLIGYVYATSWSGTSGAVVSGAVERVSGTWSSESVIRAATSISTYVSTFISLKYSTGTDVIGITNSMDAAVVVSWVTRTSGTWALAAKGSTNGTSMAFTASFDFSGTTVGITAVAATSGTVSSIYALKSTNSGSTFSSVETFALASGTGDFDFRPLVPVICQLNSSGDVISIYTEVTVGADSGGKGSGALKKRNHSTTTTSTIDSDTTSTLKGCVVNSTDQEFYYYADGSTLVEKYIMETSTTISNPSTGTLISYKTSPTCFDNNSSVFVSAAFGANANEVILRRISFRGTWTGPEQSDSTLTAWGTYVVENQTSGGNTVTHEVALNTISPPSSYSTVTSGSVISSDATMIYAKARVTIVMAAWAGTTIESITLNYTGSGVDAKTPTGVVFDNELYLSVTESGQSNNSLILVLDREGSFTTLTPAVTFMCRYKKLLYAGGATTGKVYKLNTGLNHNGSAYTMTATTKEDLLGSIELEKEVYKIYVLYEIKSSGTFDFSYRVNNFKYPSGATWIDQSVDQTQYGIVEIKPRDGLIRSIQFKVVSDDLDADCGIIGFVVLYGYANVR